MSIKQGSSLRGYRQAMYADDINQFVTDDSQISTQILNYFIDVFKPNGVWGSWKNRRDRHLIICWSQARQSV